jgi:flavin reductase (DIM6/NTAB) family NADH-FMN oxidoreductase RutF
MSGATMSTDFGTLMSRLDPAMVIVTTSAGGERGGCLVGFHSQSSIDPGRYCLWLSKANHTYRLALRASHLAVHFLGPDQFELAELFGSRSGDDVDKFSLTPFSTELGGVPVLDACPNWVVAEKIALLDEGGDHVCISTQPVRSHADHSFQPMRLSAVTRLTPGHDNDERSAPPTERAG